MLNLFSGMRVNHWMWVLIPIMVLLIDLTAFAVRVQQPHSVHIPPSASVTGISGDSFPTGTSHEIQKWIAYTIPNLDAHVVRVVDRNNGLISAP